MGRLPLGNAGSNESLAFRFPVILSTADDDGHREVRELSAPAPFSHWGDAAERSAELRGGLQRIEFLIHMGLTGLMNVTAL